MLFIETIIFTKQISHYLDDESYRELQNFLDNHPDAGDIIQGTGGLRKLRWKTNSKGKRGGIRIIYYWKVDEQHIYLMSAYAKNKTSDLSAVEKKLLKHMLEEW